MPVQRSFFAKCPSTRIAFMNQFMKLDSVQRFFWLWIENHITYLADDNWSFVFCYEVLFESLLGGITDLAYFAEHHIFEQFLQTRVITNIVKTLNCNNTLLNDLHMLYLGVFVTKVKLETFHSVPNYPSDHIKSLCSPFTFLLFFQIT